MSHAVSGALGRQFLFAVMAVDKGLVSRDAVVAAVNGWSFDKSVPLASRLVTMGAMDEAFAAEFEAIVDHHLRERGGNLAENLAAVAEPVRRALAEALAANPDDDVRQCVALLTTAATRGDGQRAGHFADFSPDDDKHIPEPEGSSSDEPDKPGHVASEDDAAKARALRRTGRIWPRPEFEAGRFAAVSKIGGEGMGLIYIGYDREEIGRIIALKTVKDERHGTRLRLEGEIHGQLEHPNILPVYGTGVAQNGSPFIALQHIRKGDLRKALRNFHAGRPILPKNLDDSPYLDLLKAARNERDDVPAPAAEGVESDPGETGVSIRFDKLRGERLSDFNDLLRRFTDICNAIDYAHDRGVLHRDLKPGNVMLGNHGETFVIDWGLAKLIDEPHLDEAARIDQVIVESQEVRTEAYASPGTPQYMAPEQLAGENDRVDRRTDTFALGLILCEILTGKPPFQDSVQEELAKFSKDERKYQYKRLRRDAIRQGPPDLVRTNRSIPRPLAAICRKALAFEQADRYQTAGELAREVNRWLADEPVEAYRSEEGRIEKAARWARKNRGKAAGIVASLVFMTVFVVLVATFLQILANRELHEANSLAQAEAQKNYANTQGALNLAKTRGAWNEAIQSIDNLENQIRTYNIPVTAEQRVDLKLDRLDALDGESRGDEAQSLVRSLEEELKSNPEWFDSRRRGRLYLRKGDLFREELKPGEASPFELALKEELTGSERSYVMSLTEPDPKKAIALLEDALAGNPYNVRAIVMSTILNSTALSRVPFTSFQLGELDAAFA